MPSLLIRYGSTPDVGLTDRELHYCLLVLDLRWEDEWPYLSNQDAADALGCHERRIPEIKASLKAKGFAHFRYDQKPKNARRGADVVILRGLLARLEMVAERDHANRGIRALAKARDLPPPLPDSRFAELTPVPDNSPDKPLQTVAGVRQPHPSPCEIRTPPELTTPAPDAPQAERQKLFKPEAPIACARDFSRSDGVRPDELSSIDRGHGGGVKEGGFGATVRRPDSMCSEPGCPSSVYRDGLCSDHFLPF